MKILQRSDLDLWTAYQGAFRRFLWGPGGRGSSRDHLLHQLVRHAYRRVPFYRSLFDRHGIKPDNIRGTADLHKLPIISKKDLQSIPHSTLLADYIRPRELLALKTSGSTGEPFTTYRTQAEAWLIGLGKLQILRELGLKAGDRRVFVGVLARFGEKESVWFQIAKMSGFFKIKKFDLFQDPVQNALALMDYRPEVLEGFPHALLQIAGVLQRIGRGVIRPRFMVSTAEVLTPGIRQTLEQAFQAPLYNLYSCTEFGYIAYECRQTRALHLADRPGLIIEVLKDGRPALEGEWGEITITSLFSYAMPFIRFALGDLVMAGRSACLCGKPHATIQQIQGRMADCLILPDQRIIHPYQVTLLLEQEPFSWIRQYQILQKTANQVVLDLMPFHPPCSSQMALVRQGLEALLGKGIELDILIRSSLEKAAGGKTRVCRSLVYSVYED